MKKKSLSQREVSEPDIHVSLIFEPHPAGDKIIAEWLRRLLIDARAAKAQKEAEQSSVSHSGKTIKGEKAEHPQQN